MGSKSARREEINLLENLKEMNKLKQVHKKDGKPVIVIEFSWQVLLVLLLSIAFIFWGKELVTIFLFIFVSLVMMSALKPIVHWFVRRKLPKGWAIAITYLLAFIVLSGIISAVVIPVINQIATFNETLPILVEKFVSGFNGISIGNFTLDSSTITDMTADFLNSLSLTDSFASVAGTLGSVFSLSTLFLAAVVFSIYMVIDHDTILDLGLIRISSDTKRKRVKKLVLDVENKLGSWLLGQATISVIAGATMGVVLSALGVPFALPLAVFISIMTVVPNVGAIIATVPIVLVAFLANGPLTAFIVFAIFMAYQQVENTFISPRVMGSAVGVKPVVVLVTAMSFAILFGVWGAVLAVPTLVILLILYEFYIDLQKLEAKGSI